MALLEDWVSFNQPASNISKIKINNQNQQSKSIITGLKNIKPALFNLARCNRYDAIFDGVVLIFTRIFFADRLAALGHGIA